MNFHEKLKCVNENCTTEPTPPTLIFNEALG